MVAIGRAMMSLPKCLLFDEISLGLAPIVIGELYSRILEINRSQGTTIVLVEQDTTRALSASNLCLVMLKGKIALSGATDQLDSETIRSSYFGV